MVLLYMPGLKMVNHPPSTNSNRDFRGLSLLSFLSVVDLTGAGSTARSRVQFYCRALGVWVGVDAGYVLELRAGDRIFLKASHVEDTLEFDKHLHASSKQTMPHLCHNLPGERRYVRERLKEIGLGTMTSSVG